MANAKPDIKTPADLAAYLRELGTAHISALNGLMDKVPAELKAEYVAMRDRINTLLINLKPLDQVPAASDAAYALNSFARTIENIFEYAEEFRTRIAGMTDVLKQKQTALNTLEERVTNGELVPKATATTAAQSAVDAALAPYKTEIAGLRKDQVALCGLPEAPAEVLGQAADVFSATLTQAKKNLATCTGKGMKLDGTGGTFIKKTVWLNDMAFNGEAKILADLAEDLKIKLPGGDPLQGAPGKEGEKTVRKFSMA